MKKQLKVLAAASVFTSLVAFPMSITTAEASIASIDKVLYEIGANKFSVTYESQFVPAMIDENGLYDMIYGVAPIAITVDTGHTVLYNDIAIAILDNPSMSPLEILTDLSFSPSYRVSEEIVSQYNLISLDSKGNPQFDEVQYLEIEDIY